MATENFLRGFEKKAMTNLEILKRSYGGLLNILKRSKDPTDLALIRKYEKATGRIDPLIRRKVKDMGEASGMAWRHNVSPNKFKVMIQNINKNKNKPGWARKALMRDLGEVL